MVYESESKPTKELMRSLKNLKELASKLLTMEDKKKFNKIFINDKALKAGMELPTIPHEEVLTAAHILDLAREIRMLLNMFESQGKSTVELNRALTALKNLASKVLSEKDKKKFDKVLYSIDFEEFGKFTKIKEDSNKKTEEEKVDVSKYVDTNWVPGYFDNLKKVLG